MALIPLSHIFDISYGTKLDYSKMHPTQNGIAFISRSSENNGFISFVEEISGKKPIAAGNITVTLGGTYLLSSFVQPLPFYTAQNVAVLTPKRNMTEREKLYYCFIIKTNRFRYGAFGREANRTIKSLLVPEIPDENFMKQNISLLDNKSFSVQKYSLSDRLWHWFGYDDIFEFFTEPFVSISDAEKIPGPYPFISTSGENNGISCYTDIMAAKTYPAGCITVASSGSVGETFYQDKPFKVTNMVIILKPKSQINKYIGLFLKTLIYKEKYRYSYGRKSGIDRMKGSKIKLPVTSSGEPDWQFMEDYIKTLPYSASL